jgi:prephenate dehydratase
MIPRRKIGFQGMRGAYSELAIERYFGRSAIKHVEPLNSFEKVFEELVVERIDDALLPVENSLAGSIHENFDHLATFPIEILGETILRIEHCLLAPKGTNMSSIREVMSHPQALAQCGAFIKRNKFIPQFFFDTAGAAEQLAKSPEPGRAVIASEQAAKLYGLKILSRDIADRGENFTRFLHLQKSRSKRAHSKSKASVPSRPVRPDERWMTLLLLGGEEGFVRIGQICGILLSLGIEVVHCDARPTKEAAWTYNYYLEIVADPSHPRWDLALKTLRLLSSKVKILGTYQSTR